MRHRRRLPRSAGGGTASSAPDPGRTPGQLDEYLAALDLTLTGRQHDRLNKASAVSLGTPHEPTAAALPAIVGGDASLMHRHPVPVI